MYLVYKTLSYITHTMCSVVANMTSQPNKRPREDVPFIPDGFKSFKDKVVYDKYFKLELVKIPVKRIYFPNMEDDTDEVKLKVYVDFSDLEEDDREVIRKADTSLKEAAELQNKKYSPLVDENGVLKLSIQVKFAKRKKQSIIKNDHTLTANFVFSSVYDYMNYYGVNLMVPRKDKKALVSPIPKQKDNKKDDEEEE